MRMEDIVTPQIKAIAANMKPTLVRTEDWQIGEFTFVLKAEDGKVFQPQVDYLLKWCMELGSYAADLGIAKYPDKCRYISTTEPASSIINWMNGWSSDDDLERALGRYGWSITAG